MSPASNNAVKLFPGDFGPWARTTAGVVVMLLIVQFVTGVLLAFYYVPSVDHAHQTVSFIEKVVSGGSWLRSLHHYGSQWLSLFVFLHLLQLFFRKAYQESKLTWVVAVLLLGLTMAAGATGYSLPWDARAFFSTRIAEGLLGGLPLVGRAARLWLLGGAEISTLTLSRFFAVHVLVTPFLILALVVWQSHIIWPGHDRSSFRVSLARHSIAAFLVFIALAVWSLKYWAPLGPSVEKVSGDYLPRPGAQFLWLYQLLKYIPGGLGSIFGILLPSLVVMVLLLLPRFKPSRQRLIGGLILGLSAGLILVMTTTAYLSDRLEPRTYAQLQRQAAMEQLFRLEPFSPSIINRVSERPETGGAPVMYEKWCANCHGKAGEGASEGPLRFPPLIGVSAKPQRTVDDIVGILKDPLKYGMQPPMRSFAGKLSDQDMREIAEWVVTLK